jgi:hypothetical protein
MADSRERVLRQLLRAGDELVALGDLLLDALVEHAPAREHWYAALSAEAERWRARADGDPAAARLAQLFGALAEVFAAPPERPPRDAANGARTARRDTRRKFDPPPVRWDTPARWRS